MEIDFDSDKISSRQEREECCYRARYTLIRPRKLKSFLNHAIDSSMDKMCFIISIVY